MWPVTCGVSQIGMIFVYFGVTLDGAQSSFLPLCSGIVHGALGIGYGILGLEPGSAV